MQVELITKQDLKLFKEEILEEFKLLLSNQNCENEWLKTDEVRRFLKCSVGTLQNLRIQGKLKYIKVNGTLYYKKEEVLQLFDQYKS